MTNAPACQLLGRHCGEGKVAGGWAGASATRRPLLVRQIRIRKVVHNQLAVCHRVATMRHVGRFALRGLARVCGPHHMGDARHARKGHTTHAEGAVAHHRRRGAPTSLARGNASIAVSHTASHGRYPATLHTGSQA